MNCLDCYTVLVLDWNFMDDATPYVCPKCNARFLKYSMEHQDNLHRR